MLEGWKLRRLGDVCRPKQWPTISQAEMMESGYPVFGANGQIGFYRSYNHEAPTVAVTCRGATCGTVHLTPPHCYITGNAMALDELAVDLLPQFLASSLRLRGFGDCITGSAQPQIIGSAIRQVELAIPPLPEQRQIAEILDTLDEAIRKTEAIIGKLKQVKQGLLHELLTRGIDDNGELRDPERHPEQFKDSPLGRIPKEWGIVSLAEVSEFVTSGSRGWAAYYSDEGSLFLRIGNLTREHINLRLKNLQHVTPPANGEGRRTAVREGDLLVSITADLGIIGVIPCGLRETYVNQHIALVRIDPARASARWVGHYMAAPMAQQQIRRLDDPGAKAGLNLPTVRSLKCALPSRKEQDAISARIDSLDQRIVQEGETGTKFALVKDGLMEDLLTGRVRVTALLERAAE